MLFEVGVAGELDGVAADVQRAPDVGGEGRDFSRQELDRILSHYRLEFLQALADDLVDLSGGVRLKDHATVADPRNDFRKQPVGQVHCIRNSDHYQMRGVLMRPVEDIIQQLLIACKEVIQLVQDYY